MIWRNGKVFFQPPPPRFPSKSNRKSVTRRVHRVPVASLFPSRWIINQSKRQWRPEFFNQHIHIHRSAIKAEGSNERGFSAVSSSNSTQRLTRRETSGIILWESDMKFYYKNPLRCMMITWKALMRKIHLLWRIATGGSKWRKAENRTPTNTR